MHASVLGTSLIILPACQDVSKRYQSVKKMGRDDPRRQVSLRVKKFATVNGQMKPRVKQEVTR